MLPRHIATNQIRLNASLLEQASPAEHSQRRRRTSTAPLSRCGTRRQRPPAAPRRQNPPAAPAACPCSEATTAHCRVGNGHLKQRGTAQQAARPAQQTHLIVSAAVWFRGCSAATSSPCVMRGHSTPTGSLLAASTATPGAGRAGLADIMCTSARPRRNASGTYDGRMARAGRLGPQQTSSSGGSAQDACPPLPTLCYNHAGSQHGLEEGLQSMRSTCGLSRKPGMRKSSPAMSMYGMCSTKSEGHSNGSRRSLPLQARRRREQGGG